MALMKKVGSQEVAIFRHRQLQISERLWVLKGSMFYFASKCLQEGRKPQKQSKMSQSCAKVALRGKKFRLQENAKVAQKSCAAQHRNFLGGLSSGNTAPNRAGLVAFLAFCEINHLIVRRETGGSEEVRSTDV